MPSSQQEPSHPPRDPALDGLRGVATLLVFLFHYGGGSSYSHPVLRLVGDLTQAGWMGVNLFFALSGFLITNILVDSVLQPTPQPLCENLSRRRQSRVSLHPLRNFYLRRALRILPLYYAALFTCAAAALLAGAHPHRLKPLAIYALFLQNLPPLVNPALGTPPPLPVFHLWSLAVEEQFYLLWPFLLLAARTPSRAFRLSLWIFALTTLARALLFNPHLFPFQTAQTWATFLPFRAGSLTLGAALALDHRTRHSTSIGDPAQTQNPSKRGHLTRLDLPTKPLLFTAAAASSLLLIAARLNHSFLLNTPTAYALTLPAADLLAATLLALSLQPNLLRTALSHPTLTFLGRISYGFYVLHILLEPLFDHLGILIAHTHAGLAYQIARLFTAFPITVAAAWLSFTVLERPFLRLKRRFPLRSIPPGLVRNPT